MGFAVPVLALADVATPRSLDVRAYWPVGKKSFAPVLKHSDRRKDLIKMADNARVRF